MDPINPVAKRTSGVQVKPAPHGANKLSSVTTEIQTGKELFKATCPKEYRKLRNGNLIQSSFDDLKGDVYYRKASNGFVDGAIRAYNKHHHLVLRPEDVWFSVIVQLNLYINEHAEELRDMFVAHEGQKALILQLSDGIAGDALMGVDWAKFAYQITAYFDRFELKNQLRFYSGKKMEENILDPSLREWFMPAFSTTTKADQATASIIMMSAMKEYFSYGFSVCCGLPTVTLLGRKEDWEKMLGRLERLKTFGKEPTMWYDLLKPIFTKFVETFDDPESEEIKDFWQKIAHYSGGGSGPSYLSGWITAFCFWSGEGKCFYQPGQNPSSEDEMSSMGDPTPVLSLDGARYHRIETDEVPVGWASVPVILDDSGAITNAAMVAGSLGMKVSNSGIELHSGNGETGIDTIQPVTGWLMYETCKLLHIYKAITNARIWDGIMAPWESTNTIGTEIIHELTPDFLVSEEETLEILKKLYEVEKTRYSWRTLPEWTGSKENIMEVKHMWY